MASGSGAGAAIGIDDVLRLLQRRAFTPVVGGSHAGRGLRKRIAFTQGMLCVLGGMAPVTTAGGRKKRLRRHGWTRGAKYLVVHRRPSYPLVGCSPAGPTSVSPGALTTPESVLRKQEHRRAGGREARQSIAKEGLFFVQTMGSTSHRLKAFGAQCAQHGLVISFTKPGRRNHRQVELFQQNRFGHAPS